MNDTIWRIFPGKLQFENNSSNWLGFALLSSWMIQFDEILWNYCDLVTLPGVISRTTQKKGACHGIPDDHLLVREIYCLFRSHPIRVGIVCLTFIIQPLDRLTRWWWLYHKSRIVDDLYPRQPRCTCAQVVTTLEPRRVASKKVDKRAAALKNATTMAKVSPCRVPKDIPKMPSKWTNMEVTLQQRIG